MHEIEQDGARVQVITQRQCFSRIGMAYFVMIVLTIVLQLAAGIILLAISPNVPDSGWLVWLVSFLPMYGIATPVCVAMLHRVPGVAPESRPLGAGRFFICLLMSLGIMYAGNLIGLCVMNVMETLRGVQIENAVESMISSSSLLVNFLVTVLLAPVIEELLFRKLLVDRTRQFGEGLCVVLSGVLFGLFHGNLYQFFYACGLGLLFAYVYVKTGRLRYPIALHMIINFMGAVLAPLILQVMEGINLDDPMSVLHAGPQILLITLYGLALLSGAVAGAVLVIVNFRKFSFGPGACPLPRGKRASVILGNVGMVLFLASMGVMFLYSLTL